jgi:hypothetical protein
MIEKVLCKANAGDPEGSGEAGIVPQNTPRVEQDQSHIVSFFPKTPRHLDYDYTGDAKSSQKIRALGSKSPQRLETFLGVPVDNLARILIWRIRHRQQKDRTIPVECVDNRGGRKPANPEQWRSTSGRLQGQD